MLRRGKSSAETPFRRWCASQKSDGAVDAVRRERRSKIRCRRLCDRIGAVSTDPAAVYATRLAAHRSALARLEQLDARFAYARIAVFAVAIATGFLAWRAAVTPWILLAPAAAFLVLMVRHDRTIQARNATSRAVGYYERGLARIEDRWIGTGEPGTRFIDEHHPYADDLNLFGPGSLFELLSTARTNVGEEELAGWLLSGARTDVIRARQQAVAELAPAVTLREIMAVAGGTATIGVDASGLREWAGQDALRSLPYLRRTTYGMAAAAAGATVFLATTGNLLPLKILFVCQLAARYVDGDRLERMLHVAGGKVRELETLSQLFAVPRISVCFSATARDLARYACRPYSIRISRHPLPATAVGAPRMGKQLAVVPSHCSSTESARLHGRLMRHSLPLPLFCSSAHSSR